MESNNPTENNNIRRSSPPPRLIVQTSGNNDRKTATNILNDNDNFTTSPTQLQQNHFDQNIQSRTYQLPSMNGYGGSNRNNNTNNSTIPSISHLPQFDNRPQPPYSYNPKPDHHSQSRSDERDHDHDLDRDDELDEDEEEQEYDNKQEHRKKQANQSTRKRKSSSRPVGDREDQRHQSEDDQSLNRSFAGSDQLDSANKKRVKTPRACDSCRRKKIRCDAFADSEPPTCQHCKSHGLECTWFLPITETRFKRSKAKHSAEPIVNADGTITPAQATPPPPKKKAAPTAGKAALRKAALAAQKLAHEQEDLARERAALVLEAAARQAHDMNDDSDDSDTEEREREMELERDRQHQHQHQQEQQLRLQQQRQYRMQQEQQEQQQMQQQQQQHLHHQRMQQQQIQQMQQQQQQQQQQQHSSQPLGRAPFTPYHRHSMPLPQSVSASTPPILDPVPYELHQPSQFSYRHLPQLQHSSSLPPLLNQSSHPSPSGSSSSSHLLPRKEARLVGPTSIAHLMHSTSTFPTDRMAPMDFKYAQSLTVGEGGDGYIRVVSDGDNFGEEYWNPGSNGSGQHNNNGPSAGGHHGNHNASGAIQGIERGTMEKLINYYFKYHSPHFPIVSRADFLSAVTPSPLLFNALCGISALSHHVPPAILRTIKGTIRATLREEDILDNSSIVNVQALLIYAYSLELEKGPAASKSWNILGVAIRMAQDLGLHRKMGSEERGRQSEMDNVELRRRVFGGCVVADRWISAIYGAPMIIDLADCDCLLPSIYDIRPNTEFDAEQRPFLFNSALISLSILLGRILKLIYSPTGITMLSTEDADQIIADLASWCTDLPEELKFYGATSSSPAAGFLHLLYIPVRFLVTRPFMRISFQLPERFAHISVGVEQWSKLEEESRMAIEWVDKNESCLEGWFVGIYAFFISSLIQYHSHIRRRDERSLATLRLAKDTMQRLVVPDGECHVRAKIAEITHLLYHTACSVAKWAPDAGMGLSPASGGTTAITILNPTVGVRQREQDWNLKFKSEGKYFVTERETSPNDPPVVRSSNSTPANSAGVASPYSTSLRSTAPVVGGAGAAADDQIKQQSEVDQGNERERGREGQHDQGAREGGQQDPSFLDPTSSVNFNPLLNRSPQSLPALLSPPAHASTAANHLLHNPTNQSLPAIQTSNLNGIGGLGGTSSSGMGAPLSSGESFGFGFGFGLAGEGTPALFDWDQWSSYLSGQNPVANGI